MNRVNRARDAHFGILLILFAGIAVTSCGRASQDPIELRVMSYNIAAGFGDIYGIAEVIAEQQPDLVALQEVDVHWGGELRPCPMPPEAFTSRQSRRNLPI